MRRLLPVVLVVMALAWCGSARAQTVMDDFESYAVGSFPSPKWLDAGAVLPSPPIAPLPSATVIATTDAFGNPTQALSTVGDLAASKGIYTPIKVNPMYSLGADVRVDRYSDKPDSTVDDWAMQLTFAQVGVDNFAYTPQAGIYASSLTQGWRLFLISANGGPFADIDLGAAANIGTWYHLQLTLDAATGAFHSRITDIALGTLLANRTDTIAGWDPSYAPFDSFAFFGGDLSPGDTVGNIGVVDNINIVAVPEPSVLGFALASLPGLLLLAWRRRNR